MLLPQFIKDNDVNTATEKVFSNILSKYDNTRLNAVRTHALSSLTQLNWNEPDADKIFLETIYNFIGVSSATVQKKAVCNMVLSALNGSLYTNKGLIDACSMFSGFAGYTITGDFWSPEIGLIVESVDSFNTLNTIIDACFYLCLPPQFSLKISLELASTDSNIILESSVHNIARHYIVENPPEIKAIFTAGFNNNNPVTFAANDYWWFYMDSLPDELANTGFYISNGRLYNPDMYTNPQKYEFSIQSFYYGADEFQIAPYNFYVRAQPDGEIRIWSTEAYQRPAMGAKYEFKYVG